MKRQTEGPQRASSLACPCAVLLLSACGELDSHNLGDTAEATAMTAPAPTSELRDFAGSWIGQAEDPLGPRQGSEPAIYRFPSGATQIRFEFPDPPTLYVTTSYVTFGTGDPPPWPAELDAGYPPDVDYRTEELWYARTLPPIEGYAYQLGAVNYNISPYPPPLSVPDGVLHLAYLSHEAIAAWCGAQTPLPTGDGYSCIGGRDSGYSFLPQPGIPADTCSVEATPIDCGKYYLCAGAPNPPCVCTQTGCYIEPEFSDLFLSRDGDELVGVFSNSVFPRAGGSLAGLGPVRFQRE